VAFRHWISYSGVELVNAARTDAYARALNLDWFKCEGVCPALPGALQAAGFKPSGHSYTNPLDDGAPWIDAAEPYGAGFAGVHVLEVTNFDSSTWTADTSEALVDGGYVSRGRFGTREMTFRVLLLGTDALAVTHGMNWLATVLRRGDPCSDRAYLTGGPYLHTYKDLLPAPGKDWWQTYKDATSPPPDDDLYHGPEATGDPLTYAGLRSSLNARIPLDKFPLDRFLACEGEEMDFFVRCPSKDTWDDLYRYMLDVHLTAGPSLVGAHEISPAAGCSAGAWAEVEFTLTAAIPFAWRLPLDLSSASYSSTYRNYLPDGAGKPWFDTYKSDSGLDLYHAPQRARLPMTYAGLNKYMWQAMADVIRPRAAPMTGEPPPSAGGTRQEAWLDPDCPPPAKFPPAPLTDLLCEPLHDGPWDSRVYVVGTVDVPKFTEVSLVMEFTALTSDLHDVRVRLVPEYAMNDEQYDVQFYMHWIPEGATLRIDGRRRDIVMFAGRPGSTGFKYGPASHLVVEDATAATYRFPTLFCGGTYRVVVQVPDTEQVEGVGVSVLAVGREG
jgi:hypothetical protein